MTLSDLQAALGPVVQILEDLAIPYYIGGSVASSAHGLPRSSIDADVIVALGERNVRPLFQRLEPQYYVDEGHMLDAVRRRRSFNAIHLATMFKVDLFVSKGRPFDDEAMRRAGEQSLDTDPASRPFRVASPEDAVIAKLEWYRAGGEVSERQWADIVGLLKTVGPGLDDAYLDRWAAALGVQDLLARARAERI